jgi:predicted transcriptional regulator
MDNPDINSVNCSNLTADIVSAYVSKNSVPANELAPLITEVGRSLVALQRPKEAAPPQTPAVSTRRSVHSDFIICLECGKRFKSLKRHLAAHHGLSHEAYRDKWDLPPSYPMVAPNYASTRSAIAREFGLGKKSDDYFGAAKRGRKAKA